VFACVRGCSVVWRPQTDRSGREKETAKGPQPPAWVDARESRLWARVPRLSWCVGRGMR
jgi:hypothetical protein